MFHFCAFMVVEGTPCQEVCPLMIDPGSPGTSKILQEQKYSEQLPGITNEDVFVLSELLLPEIRTKCFHLEKLPTYHSVAVG